MRLHQYPELFHETLRAAADHLDIKLEFVEKDYWISLLLFRLSKSDYTDQVVFKGGTSLSKGFDLIERFSEDVDIAVINEEIDSGNQLKKLIRTIEKEITEGLKEISVENVTSKGSRFRKSVFEYPSFEQKASNNKIIVEINSFANPFPYQRLTIQPMVYDFLTYTGNEKYADKHELVPFELNVLNKEQTLMEKVVSLIRVSFNENEVQAISEKIRHFYDLYYLVTDKETEQVVYSESFKSKFNEILNHDRKVFDEPKGWSDYRLEDSVLVNDFPAIWEKLKQKYQSELSALAYRPIPKEEDVAEVFADLLKRIL